MTLRRGAATAFAAALGVLVLVLSVPILPPAAAGAEPEPGSEDEQEQEDPSEDEQEQEFFRGMPADEGRLEVFGFCASCHSIDLVLQQGLTRAVWEEVLVDMVDEYQMVSLPAEISEKVLDYLEKYYGPDRRAKKEQVNAERS